VTGLLDDAVSAAELNGYRGEDFGFTPEELVDWV
jgi:hypothetical protein